MASIVGYGSKHSHEFTLTVNEDSISQSGNYSTVSFTFTIYKSSYSWSGWNSISYIVTINGLQYTGTIPKYTAGSTMTITSGTLTVPHDNNGGKLMYFSFSVADNSGQSYTCGNAYASGNMYLTNIPRQPNAPAISLYEVTDSYLVVNWSTNMVIDGLWVSYDYGTTWKYLHNPNNSYGRVWFGPMAPNRTINIMLRVRSKESQLTADSAVFTATTLDISRMNNIQPLVHGEPIVFNVTSPANNSPITLEMIVDDTEVFSRNIVKGNNSVSLTDSELDLLYSKYGNNSSVSAVLNLYSTNYYGERNVDSHTETVTLKGNQKTGDVKVGNNWKRGKAWTNVNGTWKRGVIWTKVSGSWKRGM